MKTTESNGDNDIFYSPFSSPPKRGRPKLLKRLTRREYAIKYYYKNREQIKEKRRKYYLKNRDKILKKRKEKQTTQSTHGNIFMM